MRTVVPWRFAEEGDKSEGESGAIDIERKAPKARQWKYGGGKRKVVLPFLTSPPLPPSLSLTRSPRLIFLTLSFSVVALFSLQDAMNGSFYEPRAYLFRPSRNIGRTLFLFLLPSAPSSVRTAAREPPREREFFPPPPRAPFFFHAFEKEVDSSRQRGFSS